MLASAPVNFRVKNLISCSREAVELWRERLRALLPLMVAVKGRAEERLGKHSSQGSRVSVAKRKGKEEEQRLPACSGADMLMP